MHHGLIYLVESQTGILKIGFSANPSYRLSMLQPCSPCLLRLIAQWPAFQREEYALHKRFREQRLHYEWFLIDGPLAAFVEQMRGTGLSSVLDWAAVCEPRRQNGRITKTGKLHDFPAPKTEAA